MKHLPRIIVLVVLVLGITHALTVYGRLPDRVATHFWFGGQADGFGSKQAQLTATLIVYGILAEIFLILIPVMLRFIPLSMVNMPDKAYWMAPERRPETIGRMMRWFDGFAAATLLLHLITHYMVCRTNLRGGVRLDTRFFWTLMGMYLVFRAILIFGFYRVSGGEPTIQSPSEHPEPIRIFSKRTHPNGQR